MKFRKKLVTNGFTYSELRLLKLQYNRIKENDGMSDFFEYIKEISEGSTRVSVVTSFALAMTLFFSSPNDNITTTIGNIMVIILIYLLLLKLVTHMMNLKFKTAFKLIVLYIRVKIPF